MNGVIYYATGSKWITEAINSVKHSQFLYPF